MKQTTIRAVIVLMSISLLGITIIQFFWLRRSIELNAENFNDRVVLALNKVKLLLEEYANSFETYEDFFNQSPPSLFKPENDLLTDLLKPTYKYKKEILKNQLKDKKRF